MGTRTSHAAAAKKAPTRRRSPALVLTVHDLAVEVTKRAKAKGGRAHAPEVNVAQMHENVMLVLQILAPLPTGITGALFAKSLR